MNLIEVNTPGLAVEFLKVPLSLYKHDQNYVRPLDSDIENVFDEGKNRYYREGRLSRWILRDEQGRTVGRIAAFVNHETAYSYAQPTGGLGFFECIRDKKAAFLLFDTARNWLKGQGMEAMDGPVNLGSRDKWWGLLTEGFHSPCYCCNYNPAWYQEFFEDYGFKVFFKQYTYIREVAEPLQPLYHHIAARLFRNEAYSFRNVEKRRLDRYVEDFRTVYNKAWVKHEGVEEMSPGMARELIESLKPVIDERIAWFAYFNGEPIGFFLCIPELNELFVRYASGQLGLITKIRLALNKYLRRCKTIYGLAFGIIPEQQRRGVEVALIVHAWNSLQEKKLYDRVQMNWIGDFNPRMMHVAEQIGAVKYKTHHTYRYLFDQSTEFERHPDI